MPSRAFFQSGWVVKDLKSSAERWLANGIGPFFILPHLPITDVEYRGTPAHLDISVGFAQAGEIQIELIQQHGEDPSAYRDVYGRDGEGFHHFCQVVDDVERELELYRARGATVVTSGRGAQNVRFCYLDTRDQIGCMTELIEPVPVIMDMFATIAESARSWDGTEPIRMLTI